MSYYLFSNKQLAESMLNVLLFIEHLRTNFRKIFIKIQIFSLKNSFKVVICRMPAILPGLNVFNQAPVVLCMCMVMGVA